MIYNDEHRHHGDGDVEIISHDGHRGGHHHHSRRDNMDDEEPSAERSSMDEPEENASTASANPDETHAMLETRHTDYYYGDDRDDYDTVIVPGNRGGHHSGHRGWYWRGSNRHVFIDDVSKRSMDEGDRLVGVEVKQEKKEPEAMPAEEAQPVEKRRVSLISISLSLPPFHDSALTSIVHPPSAVLATLVLALAPTPPLAPSPQVLCPGRGPPTRRRQRCRHPRGSRLRPRQRAPPRARPLALARTLRQEVVSQLQCQARRLDD